MASAGKKGVTLIELVMVIVITGILAGLGAMYISEVVDSWNTVSYRSETVAQTRSAMGRMSRRIRSVKNTTAVTAASAGRLQFVASDGAATNYNLSGGSLLENNAVLATGVAKLNFTYYNATGGNIISPLVAPDETDIRGIGVSLEIVSPVKNKTLNITVYPRNLGDS